MHNHEIPWFLPDIKLVFSLFSKKKYFLLAREINLFNRNYFFFFCNMNSLDFDPAVNIISDKNKSYPKYIIYYYAGPK